MLLNICQGVMIYDNVTTPRVFILPCACSIWLWPSTISTLPKSITGKECIQSNCLFWQCHIPHVFILLYGWQVSIFWNYHTNLVSEQHLIDHLFSFRPGSYRKTYRITYINKCIYKGYTNIYTNSSNNTHIYNLHVYFYLNMHLCMFIYTHVKVNYMDP